MSDVDALIQACCAVPTDATWRGALADMLAEMGEPELEAAVRATDGESVIREVHRTADALKRAPCLRLLWAVGVAKMTKLTLPTGRISGTTYLTTDRSGDIVKLVDAVPTKFTEKSPPPTFSGNSVTDNH